MRKIYLVKKNPEQPADGNNWIVMNSFEFMNFVKTPDGQKRKACFGQLDACSVDDVIIIAECGAETAKQWRSEKDRHDYLVSIENQSGMTVFSYNTQTTTEDDIYKDCSVEEEIVRSLDIERVRAALKALTPEERDIIMNFYFSENPLSGEALAEKFATTKSSIYRRRDHALRKLKSILGNA